MMTLSESRISSASLLASTASKLATDDAAWAIIDSSLNVDLSIYDDSTLANVPAKTRIGVGVAFGEWFAQHSDSGLL